MASSLQIWYQSEVNTLIHFWFSFWGDKGGSETKRPNDQPTGAATDCNPGWPSRGAAKSSAEGKEPMQLAMNLLTKKVEGMNQRFTNDLGQNSTRSEGRTDWSHETQEAMIATIRADLAKFEAQVRSNWAKEVAFGDGAEFTFENVRNGAQVGDLRS